MPGMTPNFNIRYPCQGENINPQVFADYAQDVEAAIAQVQAQAALAQNRLRAALHTADAGVAVAVNVSTQILFSTVEYNNGVEVGAGPTYGGFQSLTADQSGLYLFTLEVSPLNTVTTLTSWKAVVSNTPGFYPLTVGGSRTLGRSVATTEATRINVTGIGFLEAPFSTVFTFQWTGTGGPMNIYARATATKIGPFFP